MSLCDFLRPRNRRFTVFLAVEPFGAVAPSDWAYPKVQLYARDADDAARLAARHLHCPKARRVRVLGVDFHRALPHVRDQMSLMELYDE